MDCTCIHKKISDRVKMLRDCIILAQEEYRCDECSKLILKGEKYQSEIIVHDGLIIQRKVCLDCYDMRETFMCQSWIWGMAYTNIQEHIYACYCDTTETIISELPISIRNMICEKIEKCWEWDER